MPSTHALLRRTALPVAFLVALLSMVACAEKPDTTAAAPETAVVEPRQSVDELLVGEVMAIAYSGFREERACAVAN